MNKMDKMEQKEQKRELDVESDAKLKTTALTSCIEMRIIPRRACKQIASRLPSPHISTQSGKARQATSSLANNPPLEGLRRFRSRFPASNLRSSLLLTSYPPYILFHPFHPIYLCLLSRILLITFSIDHSCSKALPCYHAVHCCHGFWPIQQLRRWPCFVTAASSVSLHFGITISDLRPGKLRTVPCQLFPMDAPKLFHLSHDKPFAQAITRTQH